jgi:subtilase family serine protease
MSAPGAPQSTADGTLGPQVAPNVRFACPQGKPGYAQCLALVRTDTFGSRGPGVSGYGPSDLQSAYNLPSSSRGFGQTIAVIDSGDNPKAEFDLNAYRAYFGQPPCTMSDGCFQKLNQDGYAGDYPPGSQGDGLEIDLDIEMVSAACPNCRIMLVESKTPYVPDLAASVDTAASKGANVVSNSYQLLGNQQDDAYASHYDHSGVVIVAADGDRGYENEMGFPADQPTVVAVGGTTLTRAGNARGWSETVWNFSRQYGGTGGGSGCTSARTPKPAWQRDRKPGDCLYRTTSDVAAVADPNTGVAEYDSYGPYGPWLVAGGTSAAAPLIAGVYGLAENATTQDAARSLYRAGQTRSYLYDITAGFNGTCSPSSVSSYLCVGARGYDGPTGNGSPHGIGAF